MAKTKASDTVARKATARAMEAVADVFGRWQPTPEWAREHIDVIERAGPLALDAARRGWLAAVPKIDTLLARYEAMPDAATYAKDPINFFTALAGGYPRYAVIRVADGAATTRRVDAADTAADALGPSPLDTSFDGPLAGLSPAYVTPLASRIRDTPFTRQASVCRTLAAMIEAADEATPRKPRTRHRAKDLLLWAGSLHAINPDWTQGKIAEAMGISAARLSQLTNDKTLPAELRAMAAKLPQAAAPRSEPAKTAHDTRTGETTFEHIEDFEAADERIDAEEAERKKGH